MHVRGFLARQSESVSTAANIAESLTRRAFIKQFHPSLLDDPDQRLARLTFAKEVDVIFVKSHPPGTGEEKQVFE